MKRNFAKLLMLAAVATTGLHSCKKLDQQPLDTIETTKAITSAGDVESALIGCYASMGSGALYGTNFNLLPELLASENYCRWRGTFTGPRQVANKTMTRDNGEASRTWIAAYEAINAANTVLDNLSLVTDTDQKAQLEGEALWARAIVHFELVRLFALPYDAAVGNNNQPGVPYVTTSTKNETDAFLKPARKSVEEVYAAVIADLTAAAAKLPATNGTRATSFTAQAFLAKVYLQKGDYAKARDAADAAIAGDYQLNASVLAVFSNKNTKESFFEIQQNEQNNAGVSNDGLATFYASLPGVGRADVRMYYDADADTYPFLDTYPTGDLRRTEWYYVGTGARPGNIYCGKWNSFSQNIPVVRLAEMYLIRAEGNLRLGTTVGDTPANDLAKVRNPIRTNLPSIANPTLADVLAERKLELAFEGFRIHEVRRLKESFDAYTWNDDVLVLPIPQREIDANSSLTQNPGY